MFNSHCDIQNSYQFVTDVYICHVVLSWLVYIIAMVCFKCWWLLAISVCYISCRCELLCYSVYREESMLSICVLILLLKSKHIVYYIFNKFLSATSKAYADSGYYAYDFWNKVSKTCEESASYWNWNVLIADICGHSIHFIIFLKLSHWTYLEHETHWSEATLVGFFGGGNEPLGSTRG